MVRICILSLAAWSLVACADAPRQAATGPEVAIDVAPLSLEGVADAAYRLTVENGSDQVVWTREVTSSQFGDGAGSLSYVGPCDADDNDNTVTLELLGLYAGPGQTQPIDAATWRNPGPLSRDFACVADQDVDVSFDITLARDARQGFFDVAVELDNVFCSAKLDCGATTAPEDDILLLHQAGSGRATTAVLGFACTGDPTAGGETYLYLDRLRIDCGANVGYVVVDTSVAGNVDLTEAPNVNTGGYLFGAAVFRGVEQLANKVYWNVALGLDVANFPADTCTLHALGTAASEPLANATTPAGTSWPLIAWDVNLTAAGARVCTDVAVDGGGGVRTTYTSLTEPEAFDAWWSTLGGPSVPTAPPVCGDGNVDPGEGCDDGNTVSGDGCGAFCQTESDPPAVAATRVLWARSDSGLVEDVGGVQTWQDLSGAGHHLAAPSAAARPDVTADQLNGFPAVTFTSGNVESLYMGTDIVTGSDFAVFVVARRTGPAEGRILNAVHNNWLLGWWSTAEDQAYQEGWISATGSPATTYDWIAYASVGRSSSGLSTIYRNGRILHEAANTVAPNGIALGEYGLHGGENSDSQVVEVIVYDGALSAAETQAVFDYLSERYAETAVVSGALTEADPGVWSDGGLAEDCEGYRRPEVGYRTSGAADGFYRVDPDGAGGVDAVTVYCDMTWSGGGWTMVRSTTQDTLDCYGVEGTPRAGVDAYLSAAQVQALANVSTVTHLRTIGLPDTRSATSYPEGLPIQNLRNAQVLNLGEPIPSTAPSWYGPMRDAGYMDHTCVPNAAALDWPSTYHACGNANGLHLHTDPYCRWDLAVTGAVDNEAMALYVR